MNAYKPLEKYSLGVGDRFAQQGKAQLRAFIQARQEGIEATPVWNKSNREHVLVGTEPASVLAESQAATAALGWQAGFHVDADHINLANVERFIEPSDFFTIDVADYTARTADPADVRRFVDEHRHLVGTLAVPGLQSPLTLDAGTLQRTAERFLWAMQEAGRIYRHLAGRKTPVAFVTEVSVDETDAPQTPAELLLILAMIAGEGIPAQTVAPKFTGRFNKGVDYVGDQARFAQEFAEDLCVLRYAVQEFGLPASLKLSVHSGSDKFSLYPILNRVAKHHDAGLHVKTAGTTWLEELIGLAEAGGEGLALAREIYGRAAGRFEELIQPYAPVVDIDRARLPAPAEVAGWSGARFAAALRHAPGCPAYNPHFRQFLHVSFRVAAELGAVYTDALARHEADIARNVTGNLFERHLRPIFG